MSKINFEGDAVANLEQTGLESVAELLREQLRLESVIADTEEQLKGYKEHLRKLSGEVIPSKMAELGMTSTTMYDGSKVDVVEDIYVSIPKDAEKSTACYQWLTDNGLGDIIKNQVGIAFGMGEREPAEKLQEFIKILKVDVDDCSDVSDYCEIKCMPTFKFYKNNEFKEEINGASEEKISELIKKYLSA